MKQDTQNGMKLVRVNVDQMHLFLITNKDVMKVTADVNTEK